MNSQYMQYLLEHVTHLVSTAISVGANDYFDYSLYLKSDLSASIAVYIDWKNSDSSVSTTTLHPAYQNYAWGHTSGSVLSPSGINEA